MAQFLSYTFLPSDIAPPVRRIDLAMSLTAGDANSSGLARNSPYSSSGSGAGAWAARVFAATPNTINVPEIRRCAGLINRDSSERHAIYRALATICFLRHAWRDH